MTKTAYIMMVSLFASGLCITPFSIAAPAKQSKTAACNAQANDKGLGEEKDDGRTGVHERMHLHKAGKGGWGSTEQDENLQ